MFTFVMFNSYKPGEGSYGIGNRRTNRTEYAVFDCACLKRAFEPELGFVGCVKVTRNPYSTGIDIYGSFFFGSWLEKKNRGMDQESFLFLSSLETNDMTRDGME